MCGIIAFCRCAGVSESSEFSAGEERGKLSQQLEQGLDLIRHRGPDGSNTWLSADSTVGLGHCRLAINDLSSAGLQPLHTISGDAHAVVNGELYDYDNLREHCENAGYQFSSATDSELVLALYKIYGAPGFFEHLRGEFAFVLYDNEKGKTIVGRDRYGIKPLTWTILGDKVLFAAESKAFLAFGWRPEWDVSGISTCGWLSDDKTMFKGVRKLMPGHWMEISDTMTIHKYWDLEYPDKTKPDPRDVNELIEEARERLVDAVRLRMKADVPIGMFLSGGIDSSAVLGIMTHLAREENVQLGSETSDRVTCFTIQFPEDSTYDESEIADRTAKWLGIKHYRKLCDEAQLANDFSDAVYHSEHQLMDMNSVAKFTLSTVPQELGIKVILTGEGSDEHFAGYSFFVPELLREPDLGNPKSELTKNTELREALFASAMSESQSIMQSVNSDVDERGDGNGKAQKDVTSTLPATMVSIQPANSLYAKWVHEKHGGFWDKCDTILDSITPDVKAKMQSKWHPGHTAFYIMIKTSLQNIILAGMSDRAEMAHSIEGRPPFLDHHLTDYINMVPPTIKTKLKEENDGSLDELEGFWWKNAGSATRALTEKWLLREAARPFITDELYKRRKQPFLAPAKWPINGPMQKLFQEMLTEERVNALGFVHWPVVAAALDDAFGETSTSAAFRLLTVVGSWVVIQDRFGVKTATPEDYEAL